MKSLLIFVFILLLVNFCFAQEKIELCYQINNDTLIVGYHSEIDIGAISLWFFHTGYQIDTVIFLEPAQNMDYSDYRDSLGMLRILVWSLGAEIIPKGTDYLLLVYLSGEGTILLDTAEVSDNLGQILTYEEVDCSELWVDCPELEEKENLSLPENFTLFQNYPNPFNLYTNMLYKLKGEFFVKLEIYDLLGRKVKTVISEKQTPGFKSLVWDGKDEDKNLLPSGVYFYRLKVGDQEKTKKMVLLK